MRVCMYACMRVCVCACMRVCAYVLWHAQYAAKCAASCVLGCVVCMCTTEMPGMPHNCVRDTAQLRACMHACQLCYAMLCMRVRGRQACAHSHIRLAAHALRMRAAARRTAEIPTLLRTHTHKQQTSMRTPSTAYCIAHVDVAYRIPHTTSSMQHAACFVFVCMYICMYVCMYACKHVCVYACMRLCMYMRTLSCYKIACMHACMPVPYARMRVCWHA